MLTPDDLAAELGVSLMTLWRWRRDGTGPPFAMVGRHVRYRRRDVDRWLDSRTAA
jgi:excisionase family DNA binding protein